MQQQWARVQMFAAFNTVAFPIVFGTEARDEAKFVISLVGFWIHVLVLIATWRADGWITYLDERMAALERLDREDPDSVRVMVFGHSAFLRRRGSILASRRVFGAIGIAVAVGWLWLALSIFYGQPSIG
ncbi:hypothetical protein C4552_00400 [Candidatus Parcubacteria bacterium]|nr:MAG: hypothetical protein C4552_00400 [Candidatus Parcubacteria bacterium]